MKHIITMVFSAILVMVALIHISYAADKEITFNATVTTIEGRPIFVNDFTNNGQHFYEATQNDKKVRLPFKDLREIRFLNPGKNYQTEILFTNNTRDTYFLKPDGNLTIRTSQAIVSLSHSKLAKIEFGTSPPPPPKPQAKIEAGQFDRIFLKNGDILSGLIQTKKFKVTTSYGAFDFETPQISYITFEGRGKDIDVMGLRIGDVLSGSVEVKSVNLRTRSGQDVNLESEKIKRITFRK